MMDRLGILMPRLAAVSPGADVYAADVLMDLRVGLNVIGLQREIEFLGAEEQMLAARVLRGVARHYEGNPLQPPAPGLLAKIDRALEKIARKVGVAHGRHHREALMVLVGLRLVLFPTGPAPPFEDFAPAPAMAAQ
jgi:hypothetical protein